MNTNTAKNIEPQPKETMTDPSFHVMGEAPDVKSNIESAIEEELKKSPQAEAMGSQPVGLLNDPYTISSEFVEELMENIIKATGALPSGVLEEHVSEEQLIRVVTKAYKNEYDISLPSEVVTAAVMSAFGHIQTSRSKTKDLFKRNRLVA
jgi:hypothetical protein